MLKAYPYKGKKDAKSAFPFSLESIAQHKDSTNPTTIYSVGDDDVFLPQETPNNNNVDTKFSYTEQEDKRRSLFGLFLDCFCRK